MYDPVVEELWSIRQAHSDRFGNNPELICSDFREKQMKYKDRLVSLKPKLIKRKENNQDK